LITYQSKPLHLLLAIALVITLGTGAFPPQTPVRAQPSGWPTTWTGLNITDPNEGGCDDFRNVFDTNGDGFTFYYATDSQYLYLRMETVSAPGWATTGDKARYKWFFDTAGTAADIQGGSVRNAEFLLIIEDRTDTSNVDGNRDTLGELTLMDDLANIGFSTRWTKGATGYYLTNTPEGGGPSSLWRRAYGSGTGGVGGPQGVMSSDIGYRIDNAATGGNFTDMYISWSALGNPSSLCLLWATDQENPNLEQAPACDSPTSTNCFSQCMPPVAAFNATPTSGCAPLTVNFTDQSTGNITSWSWTFGDGGNSTAQNATHSYAGAGTYNVTLTVSGACGNNTKTETNYITVTAAPTANFTANVTSGCAPLTVQFTDNSTGSPTSWNWTFGDGGNSTAQNPSHNYTSAGNYTVSLTVSNACGNNTKTETNYITVTAAPTANFTANVTSGCAPLAVQFTDNSTGSPTGWSWSFPGGSPSSANTTGPHTVTYNSLGTYNVTLTVSNACGNNTKTETNYITVVEACEATAPDFSICEGTTVDDDLFTSWGANCSAGCNLTLSYSFDGSTAGTYSYNVTCDNGVCDPTTETGNVTVVAACEATAPDFSICEGTTVDDDLFTSWGANCSAGCNLNLSYSFDGSTPGVYSYNATCNDGVCGPDVATGNVTVVAACVATAPDFSICEGTTVDDDLFTSWGANCSAGCNLNLSYSFDGSTAGTYSYNATCNGGVCGPDVATGNVTVVAACVATAPDFSICAGTTVDDALFTTNGANCSAGCSMALNYSFDGSTAGVYSYNATCDNGVCTPDVATGNVMVVAACEATAPDFSICEGTTVDDDLFTSWGANCSAGCNLTLSYSFDGSAAGVYSYNVTCNGGACGPDVATGNVTVVAACVATAPNFSICEGTTVDDALFTTNGANCSAGCSMALNYSFDGSTPGVYSYNVTCNGGACGPDVATGNVTVVAACVATAPNFSICVGTTVDDALFTTNGANCSADCSMTLNYSAVNSSTPGVYSYNATCNGGACGPDVATGNVTVVAACVATAPNFSICVGTTVDDALFTTNGANCSAGCNLTLSYSFDGSTPGVYSYNVTCNGGACGPDVATGNVTVVAACVATAPNFSICVGTTVDDALFTTNGANCSADCSMTLNYSAVNSSTPGVYSYNVTCNGGACGPDVATGNVTVVAASTWYQDNDNDNYGNATVTQQACSQPSGYVSDNTDCDDTDPNVHPGATEVCNGIDDDCDLQTDEEGATGCTTYYRDDDNDGYGQTGDSKCLCAAADPYDTTVGGDCNDSNAAVNPAATEVCNGIDDNCDGNIDEGCTYTISGTVWVDGTPQAGVLVTANSPWTAQDITDADGRYELTGVPYGETNIHITATLAGYTFYPPIIILTGPITAPIEHQDFVATLVSECAECGVEQPCPAEIPECPTETAGGSLIWSILGTSYIMGRAVGDVTEHMAGTLGCWVDELAVPTFGVIGVLTEGLGGLISGAGEIVGMSDIFDPLGEMLSAIGNVIKDALTS